MLNRRHFLASAATLAAAPSFARDPKAYPAVQALADRYVTEKKLAGLSFALSFGGAPVSYVNAGTLALDSAARADENSLWRVYSMSKPLTGAAAALLVEDGKLALDQPISDFIPAFAKTQVAIDPAKSLDGRAPARAITVRNLLTHTAGLAYVINGKGPVELAYAEQGLTAALGVPPAVAAQTLGLPVAKIGAQPRSLQEFAAKIAALPLLSDPGTAWHYSVALDVMGAVIEQASGMPFDAFLQKRLFRPLDMRSTAFRAVDPARLVTNYAVSPEGLRPIDSAAKGDFVAPPPFPMGGSGVVSSARDYFRYGAMLRGDGSLDGVRVMKPETARLIHSNILPPGVRFTDGKVANCGFGFGGRVVTPDTTGANDGPGSYAWSGAAGTTFVVDPSRGAVIVMMIQIMPGEAYPIRKELRQALISDLIG